MYYIRLIQQLFCYTFKQNLYTPENIAINKLYVILCIYIYLVAGMKMYNIYGYDKAVQLLQTSRINAVHINLIRCKYVNVFVCMF